VRTESQLTAKARASELPRQTALAAMDDAIANGTLQRLRRARRLFAAPPLPLHRYRSGALLELRDFHELPILCRYLRALGPRAHGATPAACCWHLVMVISGARMTQEQYGLSFSKLIRTSR
jgi:hypothetical protein